MIVWENWSKKYELQHNIDSIMPVLFSLKIRFKIINVETTTRIELTLTRQSQKNS